jgi:hypothetical protein
MTIAEIVKRWPLHVLVYGDSGAKKSTFAATFSVCGPMLVFMFDPRGKDRPYLRAGTIGEEYTDDLHTPCQQVLGADGEVLIQVEHFIDAEPEQPEAYQRFRTRMQRFSKEYDLWTTVVFDSLTFMEIAARGLDKYRINRGAKDGRQHYAASADAIEQMLGVRAGSFPMNVVVVAHIDEQRDEEHGTMIYNPAAPGRQSKKLPAGYAELYRAYVTPEGKYLLQTEKSSQYNCASQIPAPNPCRPEYEALWTNTPRKEVTP